MTGIVLATGDLAMDRDRYDESFVATRDVLRSADIVFGQLETSFAERGTRLPQARLRQFHVRTVRLEVSVENLASQAFYARLGYEPCARIEKYYLGCIAALVLQKSLT